MSLARGLDYYTGMIFEGVLQGEDAKHGIGSIAGGGRYDNLIGMFSNKQIPSTGGSVGIERIFNILEMRAKKASTILNPTFAFISSIGCVPKSKVFEVANWCWDDQLTSEIFYEDMKLSEQIVFAASRGAKCMILVAEEELGKGKLLIKDLTTKDQQTVDFSKVDVLRNIHDRFELSLK